MLRNRAAAANPVFAKVKYWSSSFFTSTSIFSGSGCSSCFHNSTINIITTTSPSETSQFHNQSTALRLYSSNHSPKFHQNLSDHHHQCCFRTTSPHNNGFLKETIHKPNAAFWQITTVEQSPGAQDRSFSCFDAPKKNPNDFYGFGPQTGGGFIGVCQIGGSYFYTSSSSSYGEKRRTGGYHCFHSNSNQHGGARFQQNQSYATVGESAPTANTSTNQYFQEQLLNAPPKVNSVEDIVKLLSDLENNEIRVDWRAYIEWFRKDIEKIDNFCKENNVEDALRVLKQIQKRGFNLSLSRYLCLIRACAEVGQLHNAKSVHTHLIRSKIPFDIPLTNKILHMYLECGSVSDAYELFNKMPRNVTSWDTMITGLTKCGLGEDALDLFTRFKEAGYQPDGQMFMGVFIACAALSDIDEGMWHFESMSKVYGIVPSMEHYVSVVNMFGSIGYLSEAMEFIDKMPFEPNIDIWETLMNLCRAHGDIELGDHCAEFVNYLDPSHLKGKSKEGLMPGKSCCDKERSIIRFSDLKSVPYEDDASLAKDDKIVALLRGMILELKDAGFVSGTRRIMLDIDEQCKEEEDLILHREFLALAYNLAYTRPRSDIVVPKEEDVVCSNCHNAFRIISTLVGRRITVPQIQGGFYHSFKDGLCSCDLLMWRLGKTY